MMRRCAAPLRLGIDGRHLRIVCLLLLTLFPGPVARGQQHTFRIDERDGVRIAENNGIPKYSGELFAYEPLLTIKEDERPESLLYRPGQLFLDGSGQYVMADGGNMRICAYDSTGRFRRSFGRLGGGPGEFQYLRLQSVRDGIVSIFDFGQRRTTRYSIEGELLDVTPVPSEAGTILDFFELAPSGERLALAIETPLGGFRSGREWARLTVFDARGDSCWDHTFDPVEVSYTLSFRTGGGNEVTDVFVYHFSSRPMCVFSPIAGIVYSSGREPRLEFYDLTGALKRVVTIGLASEGVSRAERRRIDRFLQERIEKNPGYMGERFRAQREQLQLPERKAFWSDMEIDDAGFIWLRFPTLQMWELERPLESHRYYVVGPDGEYLGITQRPACSDSRVMGGRLLATLLDTESRETSLAVFTVCPASSGLRYPAP